MIFAIKFLNENSNSKGIKVIFWKKKWAFKIISKESIIWNGEISDNEKIIILWIEIINKINTWYCS